MKSLWLIGFLAVSSAVSAEITYKVDVLPDSNTLHVTMRIPKTDQGAKLQIPNWAPGAYVLRDTYKSVSNLKATDGKGKELKIEAQIDQLRKFYTLPTRQDVALNDVCTWNVAPAKETIVEYDIPSRLTLGAIHWSGPSVYMYELNRKDEKIKLQVRPPAGWPVYVGLDEIKPGTNDFKAPTYDVLADNPVTTGTGLLVDSYVSRGKTHTIVMRGAGKDKVDRANLIKACRFVTQMQTDFFGGSAPYSKYIWHFDVNEAADGAGGLEHLSSTQISLASGVGPRAVSVLSHEFFHLWNVKRIRSSVLGPFDYTKLPTTGALWWLEGVTDYYASTLLYRYGWTNEASYFSSINSNYQTVLRNSAFKTVGPHESSLRVAETSNGRGNSNGYLISYYNLGWLAGMCLDLEIRTRSNGKYSLDDVERALWAQCKNDQPGFAETDIRKWCVKFGGAGMGDAYDRIVMQPDMPVAASLALAGLEIATTQEPYVDLGFSWSGGGQGITALVVTDVRGPASGKLMPRDTILAINGVEIKGQGGRALGQAMAQATANAAAGTTMRVTIQRGDKVMEIEVTPVTANRDVVKVIRKADATPGQKAIAEAWLKQFPMSKMD